MNRNCIYQSKFAELQIEWLYTIEVNSTFSVSVKSYGFTGTYNFCLHKEQIKDIILNLKEMDKGLSGLCKILDTDSNSFITLEFEEKRLAVYGQLGGDYEENFMKFRFMADQTIMRLLIHLLSNC